MPGADRPARSSGPPRICELRERGGSGRRHPLDGGARRSGDRLRRGVRHRARGAAGAAPHPSGIFRCDGSGVRDACREPADGGESLLGARAHALGARRAPGRPEGRGGAARRDRARDFPGRPRDQPRHRPRWREARARRRAHPHPLQHRRARHCGARHRARGGALGARRRQARLGDRERDPALPARRAPHRLGADPGEDPRDAHHRQLGRPPHEPGKGGRGDRRCGPHRRKRRRREQDRHLPACGPGAAPPHPVLCRRAAFHHRPADGERQGDSHRRAWPRRSHRLRRGPLGARRRRGRQSRLRHHAGEAGERALHRERRRQAAERRQDPKALQAMKKLATSAALLVFLSGCASPYFRDAGAPPLPPPHYSLADLPQPEYWTGIVFNGAKVGFSHSRVTRAAQQGLYELHGEAVIRFRFLGLDKRVQTRSLDTVDENAKLVRFDYHYVLDDSEQRVTGGVRDGRLGYEVATAQRPPERKEERLSEPLYPSGALGLLPALQGLRIGSEFRWLVFNGETQSLDRALQRVESYEASELFEGEAFKVQTDMLGLRSTSWIDARGRPVFELGLNGVMISALEDEQTAKGYLASAALNKDDVIVQWSLVKAALALPDPRQAQYLRIALPSANRMPLSDERQRCRTAGGEIVCEIDAARSAGGGSADADLRPSATVQSRDPTIRALAKTITGGSGTVQEKTGAVLAWLEQNISKEPVDTFSALDVLDARRGECQGHSYLYAALMRSLGVPTRVVNGLVYSAEHGGFLYHTWAESLVEGSWRSVDPTFNQ